MRRLMVVENKKATVEFDLSNVTIAELNEMYIALDKVGLGWNTKEFKYDDYSEQNSCYS